MPDDRPRMSPPTQDARRDNRSDSSIPEEIIDHQPSAERGTIPWRSSWQLPLALVSILLIGGGFWTIKQGVTQPDPEALLSIAEQRLAEGRLKESGEFIDRAAKLLGEDDSAAHARAFASRGDLEARRPRSERDNRLVLSFYEQAQQFGRALTPEQKARRAASLAALGRYDAAFVHLLGAPEVNTNDVAEGVRRRVLRVLVEEALSGDTELRSQLIPVLDEYGASSNRTFEECAWSSVAAARLRLESGDPEGGLEHLMRAMRRLDARQQTETEHLELGSMWYGRIYGTLGRLWRALGDRDSARNALDIALQRLGPGDEERRRAEAAMAWIEFADGNFTDAISRFDAVLAANPSRMTQLEVRLWRAEAYAVLGEYELSEQDYAELLSSIPDESHPIAQRITLSLCDRVGELVHLLNSERAIRFGELLLSSEHVRPGGELLAYTADAYYARGSELLGGGDPDELHAIGHEQVSQAIRRESSRHFRRAGELYSMLGGTLKNVAGEREAWARAQASAAESFDLGADRARAIDAYVQYLEATDEKDLQRARIAFCYARVLHSGGSFDEALAAYDELIKRHGGGAYAAAAHVESARCLVELDREQEARARLESIERGVAGIRPEALEYREAMFELGSLLCDIDELPAAVMVLDEAIRRYPDDTRVSYSTYSLGRAHRSLAKEAFKRGEDGLRTPSQRAASKKQQEQHLKSAVTAFEMVMTLFGERNPATFSDLEVDMFRNASVYRADAAFELGRYEECVSFLEDIERRYRTESTSLDALIRLVEVWDEIGDHDMAEKAHRRAELRLRQLPEEAFEFPASRFDREAWRIWLERRPMRGVRMMVQE